MKKHPIANEGESDPTLAIGELILAIGGVCAIVVIIAIVAIAAGGQ